MRIDVSEVKRIPGKIEELELVTEFKQEISWQGEKLNFTKPLFINLTLEGHKGGTIFVRGTLKSAIQINCSRCLEPFDFPVEAHLEGEFFPEGKSLAQDEEEFPGQFYSGDTLQLDGLVQESIYLTLPMQFLCSPDCRGLCPHCGSPKEENCNCENEQVDPRLEVLKQLLKEKS